MRIVNIKKFIEMICIIVGIIVLLSFIFITNSYSNGEVKTKTICVSRGDTLWKIAGFQQTNNTYYANKDIREIIYEIRKLNNLENNSELNVGQLIHINTF